MKVKKRYYIRIFIGLVLFVLMLPVLLFFLFRIAPVQRYLNDKITDLVEQNLNTKIYIGNVAYTAPMNIVLSDIYLADYQQDTLLFLRKITVRPLYYSFRTNKLTISKINIDRLRFEYRIDSTGFSNIDYLIAHLPPSEEDTSTTNSDFKLKINKIDFKNSSIFYSSAEKDTFPLGLDLDTLDLKRVNFKVRELFYSSDSIALDLQNFSLIDKSGFRIKNISTKLTKIKNFIELKDFYIKLNTSRLIFNKLSIYEDTLTGNNNIYTVKLLRQSMLNTHDLAYFSEQMKNYPEKINIGLSLSGALADINFSDFYLKYRNYSIVNFYGKIIGLPDINRTYIDLNFNKLQTSKNELFSIRNPFNDSLIIEAPNNINVPNIIDFNGNITGLLKDFSINGDITTTSGSIELNLDIINDKIKKINGSFRVDSFNLGYVLQNNTLGSVTLSDSIDLSIDADKNIFGNNSTNIYSAGFKGYQYKNIDIASNFDGKIINLDLNSCDQNFKMQANISYDRTPKKNKLNFTINLDTANFYALHLTEDESAFLACGFSGNYSGHNIDDFVGNLQFSKPLVLIKNMQKLEIKKFTMHSDNLYRVKDNFYRQIMLNSDVMNGSVKGTFTLDEMINFAQNLPAFYFPSLAADTTVKLFQEIGSTHNSISISLYLLNLQPVLSIFAPTVTIADGTVVSLFMNNDQRHFYFSIRSDSVFISKNKFENFYFSVNGDTAHLTSAIVIDTMEFGSIRFHDFSIKNNIFNDTGNVEISWNNKSQKLNKGHITTNFYLSRQDSNLLVDIKLPTDTLYINNVRWIISSRGIKIDSSGYDIKNFTISTGYSGQNIGIRGKISKNHKDTLNMNIVNFDVSQLNPMLHNMKLTGYLNLQLAAIDLMNDPIIKMTNKISRFSFNSVNLGMIEQTFSFADSIASTVVSIQKIGKNSKGKDTVYKSVVVDARYLLEDQKFDVNLNIRKLNLKPFAPYVGDYVSFSKMASIDGNLKISGDKVMYDVTGYLNFIGAFYLVPTGVTYNINGGMHLDFSNNLITLQKTIITGPMLEGDATLEGTIKHSHFKDPYLDFSFRADTLPFLRLTRTNDRKYYGNLRLSGDFNVKGFLESLTITADVTTESGTSLTLLLDRPSDISNKTEILTFVDNTDTTTVINYDNQDEQSSANIDLDLNLHLKPESKFRIVFDEMTGEALDVQGEGNIKVKKTAFSDLVLFGNISITKGTYYFVLENIINRKFEIEKGSTIRFNGAPTDGYVDIATVYSIKNVNLYNLLLDEQYADKKTQADCYILLKGQIEEPEIKFDVKLPKADRKIQTQIDNLDDANRNKQFLSLLLIGRFQPLPGLTYDPNANNLAGTFNAGELISNQLNSMLANLGTDVDLDVNYITGDRSTTDQFDVAVSVPLLNERVSVNTDVGVGGTNVNTSNQNNFIGDFEIDVKLNKKGNAILKGYNKSNRNNFYEQGYTQGIGIQYKTTLDNLFKKDTTQNKKKIPPKRKLDIDTTKQNE